MKKSYPWIVIVMGVVLAGTLASAGEGDSGDGGAGASGGTPIGARPISFDEFRARCEHPEQFDVQRAPQNIRIQCTDSQRDFLTAAPGEVSLPALRRVGTQLFADKFFVNAEQHDVAVPTKNGSCLRFKEIERTLTIERPLACADIENMKGDLNDYCTEALDTAKGVNPKLIDTHETGRVIDTCGGVSTGDTTPKSIF